MSGRSTLLHLLTGPALPPAPTKDGPVTFWARLAAALSHRDLPIGQPPGTRPPRTSRPVRARSAGVGSRPVRSRPVRSRPVRSRAVRSRPVRARLAAGMALTTVGVIVVSALADTLLSPPATTTAGPTVTRTPPSSRHPDVGTSALTRHPAGGARRPVSPAPGHAATRTGGATWVLRHGSPVRALALALDPDHDVLVTGADDGARRWDTATGSLLQSPADTRTGPVTAVAVNPDATLLATATRDARIRISGGSPAPSAPLRPSRPVTALAFGGDALLATTDGTVIQLWDARTGRTLTTLGPRSAPVRALSLTRDGRLLADADTGAVQLWDTTTPRAPRSVTTLRTTAGRPRSVAFSPDGRTLAVGTSTGLVSLWDVTSPTLITLTDSLNGGHGSVDALAFSPDGSLLAGGGGDRAVRLWDTADPDDVRRVGAPLTGHTDAVTSLAVSADDATLASGSLDGTVRLWELDRP